MKQKTALFLITLILTILTFSCKSIPSKSPELSRELLGKGKLTSDELARYFLSHNSSKSFSEIKKFADFYIIEANAEGINSDLAFAQMCLETGYLTFGNLVLPEMHNYCGLGAMDKDHPGEWFENEQMGIRAHIQHLQAYATTEDVSLKQELIDPRYSWVHRTKLAKNVYDLAGVWAVDKEYGSKIDRILMEMESIGHK